MAFPSRVRARWSALLVGTAVAVAAPLVTSAVPAHSEPVNAERKIAAQVRSDLAKDDSASFWVYLNESADLTPAYQAKAKKDKAKAVYQAKTETAKNSQAGLRKLLDGRKAKYQAFWLVNAVRVTGADSDLAETIAQRPEVASIRPTQTVKLEQPRRSAKAEAQDDAVEWNISAINAPRVWNELGTRGEGVVVANIDTGVDYLHPAINAAYRGRNANGTYSHAYNWYDPSNICTSFAPCDNNNHGTHTMGTMVGTDIGVAPGAKWIAAKGCETNDCSDAGLLASGQWIVAPTDAGGQNPRPDLAPDVVNNSWSTIGLDFWYQATVQSWVAAGIFPAFAAGNRGDFGCTTMGSPGQYPEAYASGAYDSGNNIASFSSRGPAVNGEVKPDIAAPGVAIRSSIPGNQYAVFDGTSMASPHTAGTVALMLAYSPTLAGNLGLTRQLLDNTAIDTNNTQCGGTAANNNVFGEGRLNAFAAVSQTAHGPLGTIGGTVTSGGTALAGATVFADGPIDRTVTTASNGTYSIPNLNVGSYTVTYSKFGYQTQTRNLTVTQNTTTTANVSLTQNPSGTVTGTVSNHLGPVVGATIEAVGTPVTVTTNSLGRYTITLPLGTYTLKASTTYRCSTPLSQSVSVTSGTKTLNFPLPDKRDTFGNTCRVETLPFVSGTTLTGQTGETTTVEYPLPFPFRFYGDTYSSVMVDIAGKAGFGWENGTSTNHPIPHPDYPNRAAYALWDYLTIDPAVGGGIWTGTFGTAPNRTFVIEWRNARSGYSGPLISFEIILGENGNTISYRYKDIDNTVFERGGTATIGIENADGTDALQYSFDEQVLSNGLGITFRPPA